VLERCKKEKKIPFFFFNREKENFVLGAGEA